MKSQIVGLRVAAIIFSLAFLMHLWRLMTHFSLIIGGTMMPFWASWIGLIVAGGLALWMWDLSGAFKKVHLHHQHR